MKMNEDQIIDIWTGLKEFFDKKQVDRIASIYVDILTEAGVQDHVLKHSMGADDELDQAISYFLSENDEDDDEDELDFEASNYDYDDE
jgi:hypothetical protein